MNDINCTVCMYACKYSYHFIGKIVLLHIIIIMLLSMRMYCDSVCYHYMILCVLVKKHLPFMLSITIQENVELMTKE